MMNLPLISKSVLSKGPRIVFGICALIVIAGCSQLMTRQDVEKHEEEKSLKTQVTAIKKDRAETESRYGELQADIRNLTGKVETLEHNQGVNQQNNAAEVSGLKKTIDIQNEKIKNLEQALEATETRLTAAIQALAEKPITAMPTTAAGTHKGDAGRTHVDSRGRPSVVGGTAVITGRGEKAGKGEKDESYEEAEALLAKKEFKRAILRYKAARDKNPKGPLAADSTYKMGVCFAELGMKSEAKEFYQETLEKYPNTSASKKAKYRLSNLK